MPAQSKSQQRFMGMVRATQKGEKPASKTVAKVAKKMDKDDVEDFASTKHKGLPNKVKKETKVRRLIRKMVREIMNEDFAGAYPSSMRKSFDKKRQKQSEVLGYKLTGKPDVKTEIDDATVHTKPSDRYTNKGKLKEAKKRDYKAEYKKYGSSTKAKKYRAELNKYNRQKGTYGNGDGKDASHKGGKIVGFEEQSKNRGRAEKSRLKKEGNIGITTKKGKTIELTHKTSGKEIVVVNSPSVLKKYKKLGFLISMPEGKLNERMDAKKAKTILQQLGANRFIAMTGAKNFAFDSKYMSFRIGRNSKGINHVRIAHNAKDLYDMEFGFNSVKGYKVKKKVKDVYADMLGQIFKKHTGMNVRL
jgi:hypothetical protein